MKLLPACFAALAFAGVAQARDIYVVNHSSTITDAQVARAIPAFQAAADKDFRPEWNATATLKFLPGEDTISPDGKWWIELTDVPACWFCAGYHDVLGGTPYAVVGSADGDAKLWQVTFTHELWEMLADPYINRTIVVSPRPGVHKLYALETADPVEADRFAYQRDGVWISDFVTEAWFRRGSKGPWDFTGYTRRPLQLLEDGYQLIWTGKEWVQRFPRGRE